MESFFYKQNTLPGLTTPPEKEAIPQTIGPYTIESLLSKGGMSLLYLGHTKEKKEPVVIKVLSPEFVSHPEAIARFLKEAKIISLASHPNIVAIYGEGEWEGGLYIAMELVQGISLRQFIRQRSLSLKRSLEIILQVAYALCHLHTHGVIHRDLKPENIMITEDGEVKVIDFGVAQLLEKKEKKEKSGLSLGSPHYMSPEQKEDASTVTFASDIYSLGLIAYELIVGRQEQTSWVFSFGMINLSSLPKILRGIIEKALAVSLSERYQDIVDVITDISAYLKSKELLEERPGSDQLQELLESLHEAELSLTPAKLPEIPPCEVGLAKQKELGRVGFYYDVFKLPGNLYTFVVANCEHDKLECSLYLAHLRGIVRSSFQAVQQGSDPFSVSNFLRRLSMTVSEGSLGALYDFSLLVLSPSAEEVVFTSFGSRSLFLLPQGSRAIRELTSENPKLGSEIQTEFSITTDNWKIGDLLVLSSFTRGAKAIETKTLQDAIIGSNTLSPHRQADAILKTLAQIQPPPTPTLAITIRRIG